MNDLTKDDDIWGFIKTQESNYSRPIPVGSKEWSMKDVIERATLYRDSDIVGQKTKRTFIKNITRPILNLQYRTEDIEAKDVQIYVDDPKNYHLSFLVKKYHDDVFSQENDLDTFFDRLNQSRIDYGGGLSKRLSTGREVVPLQSIVFCDQTDMLSGPIGIKHYYSPDQLMGMESRGWGETKNGATISLKGLVKLSREEKKDNNTDGSKASTPGRYIEVYEVHGNLPKRYADPKDDSGEYETRLFIVAFYQQVSTDGHKGVILYTAPETESPFKLALRGIGTFGRALDFGGAEELFDDQLGTNYAEILKVQMLDSASKTILGAIGPNSTTIAQKNNTNNLENNEILDLGDGDLKQIDTFPRNFRLFDNFSLEKDVHAKNIGAAQDPMQGAEPTAGTPFASLQAQITQGMGLHAYRRGIFAKHIEEIYKDDYIPQIVKKITEGTTFLSELSLEDLQYVTEAVVTCETNKMVIDRLINGDPVDSQMVDTYKQQVVEQFKKKGSKHFIEIIKGEFKGQTLKVKVSVAGKSKNLGMEVDKLSNLINKFMSNPRALEIPYIAKMVNQVLEFAGMKQIDFSSGQMPSAGSQIRETISFKDLPPEGQKQLAAMAGLQISTPSPMQPTAPAYGK